MRLWGTNVYTDDSSVCTAAAQVGVITPAAGGNVTIELRAGQKSYVGFKANGVTSRDYGAWPGSFVLAGAPPIPGSPGGGGGAAVAAAARRRPLAARPRLRRRPRRRARSP